MIIQTRRFGDGPGHGGPETVWGPSMDLWSRAWLAVQADSSNPGTPGVDLWDRARAAVGLPPWQDTPPTPANVAGGPGITQPMPAFMKYAFIGLGALLLVALLSGDSSKGGVVVVK